MGETVGGNTSNLHTANTSWNLEEQLIGKDPVICREARRIVWDGPLLTTFYEVSAARVRATEMWRNFSKKVGECNKVLRQYKALREEINTARMLYTKLDIAKQKEKQAHDNRNYAQQQRSSLSLASSGQINFSEESKAEELKKYEQEIEELEKYKQAIEAREECRQALKIELEEIRKQALELWYKAEEYEHVANNFEKILKARIGADLTNEIQRVDTEFIQEEAIVDTHSSLQYDLKNIDLDASLPIILSQVLKVRAHATRVWRSLGNAANKYYEVLIEYRRLSAKLNIEKQKEEQREGNNYNLNLLWRVTNETPKSEVARLEDDIQELCRKRKEAHRVSLLPTKEEEFKVCSRNF